MKIKTSRQILFLPLALALSVTPLAIASEPLYEEDFSSPSSISGWTGEVGPPLGTASEPNELAPRLSITNGLRNQSGMILGAITGTPKALLTYNFPWEWPLADGDSLELDFLVSPLNDYLDPFLPILEQQGNPLPFLFVLVTNGTYDQSDDWGFVQEGVVKSTRSNGALPAPNIWDRYRWDLTDAGGWTPWGNVPAGMTVNDAFQQAAQVRFMQGNPGQPGQFYPSVYESIYVQFDNLVIGSECSTGDFNKDGSPDVVYRNSGTGVTVIHYLDDFEFKAGGLVTTTLPPVWEVVGFGDFDADGNADIVYRHSTNGTAVVHFMAGRQFLRSEAINVVVPTSWDAVGVTDFNKDNKPDILFRNQSSGQAVIHYMDGVEFAAGGAFTSVVSASWGLDAIGDFNTDGFEDVVYTNPDGRTVVHYLRSREFLAGGLVTYTRGAQEFVVGSRDFNGDGFADLLYRDGLTGASTIGYMVGRAHIGSETLEGSPSIAWDSNL